MERQPRASDAHLLRATRSLYHNRHQHEVIQARIERATAMITTHLALYGLTALSIGCFDIELVEGGLYLTRRETDAGLAQLPLPEELEENDLALPIAGERAIDPAPAPIP